MALLSFHPRILVLSVPFVGMLATALSGCNSISTQTGATSSTSGATAQAQNGFVYSGSSLKTSVIPPASSAPIADSFFGMTIHNLARSASDTSTKLTPFPTFDVSTFRFWDVAYWQLMEPAKGRFDWSKMDRTVQTASTNGVQDFVFTFGHVPQWASTNPSDPCGGSVGEGAGTCTSPDIAAFDDFAQHVVQRYCGSVKYYETWNEPDNPAFWDGTNSQLLTIATHLYSIAKDPANCGCTNGTCSPGGGANPNKVLMPTISNLSSNGIQWLRSYLSNAGNPYTYADVASFHGYGDGSSPEAIPAQVATFQSLLANYGLSSVPVWDTEASWGLESSPVGTDQASWLMRFHVLQAASGVSRFIWYAYDNCDWGTLWSLSPCGSGAATTNQPTVPGNAYSVVEQWMSGATLTGCYDYQNGLWACKLTRDDSYTAWIVWSSSGQTIDISIPSSAGFSDYRDWQNNVEPVPSQLAISPLPVLIETAKL